MADCCRLAATARAPRSGLGLYAAPHFASGAPSHPYRPRGRRPRAAAPSTRAAARALPRACLDVALRGRRDDRLRVLLRCRDRRMQLSAAHRSVRRRRELGRRAWRARPRSRPRRGQRQNRWREWLGGEESFVGGLQLCSILGNCVTKFSSIIWAPRATGPNLLTAPHTWYGRCTRTHDARSRPQRRPVRY